MSAWPSCKARALLAALLRSGWTIKRTSGSHHTLEKPGFPDYTFAYHDSEEVGGAMVARLAKKTGLKREDL